MADEGKLQQFLGQMLGDPAGCAAHVARSPKPDGSWMLVEPMAKGRLEDDLNPVGRLLYAASTMFCVPTSLAREVGADQGGETASPASAVPRRRRSTWCWRRASSSRAWRRRGPAPRSSPAPARPGPA